MALIVIEGLDGSGKSTQMKLLREFFDNSKIDYDFTHFPRMNEPVFGELISKFLRGELGDINSVDPYVVALLYAGDRANYAKEMKNKLSYGKILLLDRYVCSNIAYQCAKVADVEEREKLKNWILKMEYEYFSIPQPDINIYLDAPFDFVKKNLSETRVGDDRDYLNGKKDIHEADINFQQNVREVYLSLSTKLDNYVTINCYDDSYKMLTQSEIFTKILNLLSDKNLLV